MKEKKILIIDDSVAESHILKEMLEKKEYDVQICLKSEEAESTAIDFSPKIILLDVIMPALDGYQVIRNMKANSKLKDIPVIFISSKSMEFDIVWGKRQGAAEYFGKPVEKEDLFRAIEKHIL